MQDFIIANDCEARVLRHDEPSVHDDVIIVNLDSCAVLRVFANNFRDTEDENLESSIDLLMCKFFDIKNPKGLLRRVENTSNSKEDILSFCLKQVDEDKYDKILRPNVMKSNTMFWTKYMREHTGLNTILN